MFQDVFHIDTALPIIRHICPQTKIVSYFPIDGYPYNREWELPLKEVNVPITYTKWAKRTICERFPQYEDKIKTMYHGIDREVFFPRDAEMQKLIRRNYGWKDRFVAVNINRFQPRKAIALSVLAFNLFARGYKKCKCGQVYPLSMKSCPLHGCQEEDVVLTKQGHNDVTLYLHMNVAELGMGPGKGNTLKSHISNAGFGDGDVRDGIIQFNTKSLYGPEIIPDEVIADIYNGANVNISTALGEGFGLSLAEAAATGTPSIAPRNSAIPEVLGDTGHLIPNAALMTIGNDNGHIRPVVSIEPFVVALEEEYQKWVNNGRVKIVDQAAIEHIKKNFDWDEKRAFISEIFRLML